MLHGWYTQSSVKVQQPPISRNTLPPLDGFHGDLYVGEFCQLDRTGRVHSSVFGLSCATHAMLRCMLLSDGRSIHHFAVSSVSEALGLGRRFDGAR